MEVCERLGARSKYALCERVRVCARGASFINRRNAGLCGRCADVTNNDDDDEEDDDEEDSSCAMVERERTRVGSRCQSLSMKRYSRARGCERRCEQQRASNTLS